MIAIFLNTIRLLRIYTSFPYRTEQHLSPILLQLSYLVWLIKKRIATSF